MNPNARAVDVLFGAQTAGGPHREVDVDFVTRYAIPPVTVDALSFFLREISPRTVAAMQRFRHLPDLF